MAISFTLGIHQVQRELIDMQPPGCYWITLSRPEDARLLARQVLSAQKSSTLICAGERPEALLTPPLSMGAERVICYSMQEKKQALLNLPEDLARVLSATPRLVLFTHFFHLVEKLSPAELTGWIKQLNRTLNLTNSCLLIITCCSGINNLRQRLLSTFRLLNGLAHLEYQHDSWNYHVNWWCHEQRLMADRTLRLALTNDEFSVVKSQRQNISLTQNDEAICIAERQVLEGAPALSSNWLLFDDNEQVAERAHQADSATVIFCLTHSDHIPILARHIHDLRLARGSGMKIVVREMHNSLRYSDERLLLACGVTLIVPLSAPMSRFLTALEGIQGQLYSRHVPTDLDALLLSLQPLQQRGFLPLDDFCQAAAHLIGNTLLPENGKGLLVALRVVPELKSENALTLCKPRRYGDLVTLFGDRLYLFLSSCRYGDLDTALAFIFRLPPDELFSNRLVWFEDAQIASELRQMKMHRPGAGKNILPEGDTVSPPVVRVPVAPAERQVPKPIVLTFSREIPQK